MKQCRQCHYTLKDSDKFCMQCGTPVPPVSADSVSTKAHLRNSRWLWYGGGSVLVLMIASAIWVMASNNVHASPTASTHHKKSRPVKRPATHKHARTSPSHQSETALIARTMHSVVEVVVTTPQHSDLGSGFVFNRHGDILTNDHVVSGATAVSIKTEQGAVYQATIIGADPLLDVAVLHVSGLSLPPLSVNALYVGALGDNILAFGSPLGLSSTVTTGIISGLNRHFTIHGVNYQNMLQISAPIAPGNSGGPLVLLSTGKVIGMDTAGDPTSSGNIGFAIPISRVFTSALQWAAHPESNPVTTLPSSNPSPSSPPSPSPSTVPSPSPSPSTVPSPSPSTAPSPSFGSVPSSTSSANPSSSQSSNRGTTPSSNSGSSPSSSTSPSPTSSTYPTPSSSVTPPSSFS